MNKKLYILLGVSLALNFALGGYVAGKATNPVPPQRPHFAKMMPHGKHFQFIKKAFAQNAEAMKEAHKGVITALKTGDEAKIREALKVASEVRHKMDDQIQDKMVKDFMNMSDEEKAKFIKKFEGNGMKPHKCHKKFKGKHHHHKHGKMMPPTQKTDDVLPPPEMDD